ncbi:MAG: hypothetical protein LQ346_000981 [Caloplaca aetnensis]|nr:MAG: hypothetical protein LQ346_000981 [Caloplaca aetnensis]
MSTQYDAIVAPYKGLRQIPGKIFETYNTQVALAPHIKGAKVLDLACGSGYYSQLMISWGAAQVVGVDISSGMIAAGKAENKSDKIRFMVADCTIPTEFDGGPFDIVFGGWLLNYAPEVASLARMFRNICLNLKEGGHFFGVTPYPTEDPRRHNEIALQTKPLFWDQLCVETTSHVADGVAVRVTADIGSEKVQFDNYYLRSSVYEQAAREGGMKGDLEWKPIVFPPKEAHLFEWKANWDAEVEEYLKIPSFDILVVEK